MAQALSESFGADIFTVVPGDDGSLFRLSQRFCILQLVFQHGEIRF